MYHYHHTILWIIRSYLTPSCCVNEGHSIVRSIHILGCRAHCVTKRFLLMQLLGRKLDLVFGGPTERTVGIPLFEVPLKRSIYSWPDYNKADHR